MLHTKRYTIRCPGWTHGAVFVCTPLGVQGQETQNTNTVTVLLEGYVKPIEGRQPMPGVTDDGARHVAGTVALVRGAGVTLVADPGMVAERALILDALKKEGVSAEDVTHIFISHHHPDHTVNIALFPNAQLVDFWATYTGDLWEDHGDEYAIAPGIRVLQTPGHTEEDASLVVETAQGTYVLTHTWAFPDITPGDAPLTWDQEALNTSRAKVLQRADWIIPGHGKMVPNPEKAKD